MAVGIENWTGSLLSPVPFPANVDPAITPPVPTTADGLQSQPTMLSRLRGVPKAALEAIFGRSLGARIWAESRGPISHEAQRRGGARTALRNDQGQVSDLEIVVGMIEYLARQAAVTLRDCGRQAKAIGLQVTYEDGEVTLQRSSLFAATTDETRLADAAKELLCKSGRRSLNVESVDLTLTSVEAEVATKPSGVLEFAMSAAEAPA
jgi:nucleotidyltransferase/DNA polymerase involved in DNA repair